MIKSFFPLSCFTLSCFVYALGQSLPAEPIHVLLTGKGGQDAFLAGAVAPTGAVALAGKVARGNFGGSDALLVIADADLNKIFERHIGRAKDDAALSVSELPKGGWLLAGYSTSPGSNARQGKRYYGGADAWLLRLDANGQTRQEWITGTSADDEWRKAIPLSGGDVLLAGNTGNNAWIVRTDSSGAQRWSIQCKHLNLPTRVLDAAWAENRQTLYVCGYVEEQGQRHMWVASISGQGDVVWEKMWPRAQAVEGWGIDVTEHAVFVGGFTLDALGRDKGFITKINPLGTVLFHTPLGGREGDRIYDLRVAGKNSVVLVGAGKSFQRGSRRGQAWAVRCDTLCQIREQYYYGGKNDNIWHTLFCGANGQLYAAGIDHSLVLNHDQAWAAQLRQVKNAEPGKSLSVQNAAAPPPDSIRPSKNGTVALWLHPNPDLYERETLVWPEQHILVQVKVVGAGEVNKQDFCIEVNDRPCVQGSKFDEVAIRGAGPHTKTFEQEIALEEGLNTLRAVVRRPDGVVQTEPLPIVYSPRKPNLHLMAIGVPSPDLRYTPHDARDFVHSLTRNNRAFHTVFIDTLLTEAATTKTELMKSLRRLQYRYQARQIAPNDVLVVFISSHGLQTEENTFRIAAGDFDGPFLDETSLDFEREILDYLLEVDCRKLFVVDACRSGAADVAGKNGLLWPSFENNRFDILVSCRADELSYEDAQWQNGAFTQAIVEAFSLFDSNPNRVDINADDQFSVEELYRFVQLRVPELIASKKNKLPTGQHPVLLSDIEKKPLVLCKH